MATNLSLKQHLPEASSHRNRFLLVKNSESVYVNVYSSFLSWGGLEPGGRLRGGRAEERKGKMGEDKKKE